MKSKKILYTCYKRVLDKIGVNMKMDRLIKRDIFIAGISIILIIIALGISSYALFFRVEETGEEVIIWIITFSSWLIWKFYRIKVTTQLGKS